MSEDSVTHDAKQARLVPLWARAHAAFLVVALFAPTLPLDTASEWVAWFVVSFVLLYGMHQLRAWIRSEDDDA